MTEPKTLSVAKALSLEQNKYGGTTPDQAWEWTPDYAQEIYLDMARAAIEAMQAPTEAMLDAGYEELMGYVGGSDHGMDKRKLAAVYARMNDAALK